MVPPPAYIIKMTKYAAKYLFFKLLINMLIKIRVFTSPLQPLSQFCQCLEASPCESQGLHPWRAFTLVFPFLNFLSKPLKEVISKVSSPTCFWEEDDNLDEMIVLAIFHKGGQFLLGRSGEKGKAQSLNHSSIFHKNRNEAKRHKLLY